MWSGLTLDNSFKIKRGYPDLKLPITCLFIGPRGLQCETNLWELMGCTNLQEIIGWESSDVVKFDHGLLIF